MDTALISALFHKTKNHPNLDTVAVEMDSTMSFENVCNIANERPESQHKFTFFFVKFSVTKLLLRTAFTSDNYFIYLHWLRSCH